MTDPQSNEPVADTAGEQSHEDPWSHAGEEADAPADTGQPEDEDAAQDGESTE